MFILSMPTGFFSFIFTYKFLLNSVNRYAYDGYPESELIWGKGYELPNGRIISRIYVEKEGLNIYKEDDWRDFFEFFETYLLRLDAFWADFKPAFEELAS